MKISGKILDSTGEPLGLANVTIINGERANKLGAVADLDGAFELENDFILPTSKFRVSYMGFIPLEFNANDLDGKTIKLSESAEKLEEITVFGKPIVKTTTKKINDFKANLEKHKYVYAGIGGVVGLLLIASSFKK